MTPAEYLHLIVLPTLAELLAEPTDQRRAYLACITAAHLVDHVAVTLERRPDGKPDHRRVRSAVGRTAPDAAAFLAIVEGVSNGTEHAQADPKESRAVKFAPGWERLVPGFALDVEGAGWDQGRWDGPGLVVDHGEAMWFLDDCVAATIRGHVAAFPDLFAGVDLGMIAPELDRLGWLSVAMSITDDAP